MMSRASRFYRFLIPLTLIPGGLAVDKAFVRFFNTSVINRIYARAAGFEERPCLLMTTLHWKTGLPRTVVLPYFEMGHQFVVVGSLAGRPHDPIWASNVRGHANTWLRVDRSQFGCLAHVAQGEERERLWGEISKNGAYRGYQKRAHPRILPLVVHTPIEPGDLQKPPFDRFED